MQQWADTSTGPARWILVSHGDPNDRWAWSGIPESIARALRRQGQEVIRLSSDLPQAIETQGTRIARRVPRLSAQGHDAPPLVALRTARLRRLNLEWRSARTIMFGTTFLTPRVDATFEDVTVAQHPWIPESGARRRWQRRQAAIYGAASRCFTSTEWAAASIRDDYHQPPEKVVVAGFGPNTVCRPTEKDWTEPRFIWVGVDWFRKGGDLLLKAFQLASIPRARLHLVGEHPRVDLPGVIGHGPVRDTERLRAMFESATLLVLPSRFDASPIVTLEAATAGTPVLATRVGGTSELVGDAGITVEPDDVEALAAAMQRISEPTAATRYRSAAIRQAGRHTWDLVATRMIDALHGTASPSP